MLRILILLLIALGCASKDRTQYQAYSKKSGGYQEKMLDDVDLRVVRFAANSYTKKSLVYTFAEFRAIELCTEEKFKLANFLDSMDKTESRTVRRSSSSGYPGYGFGHGMYPSYYYGMSPFYNHYSGFGYGVGFSTMTGSSWDEALQYPDVEIVFECANEIYQPQMEFREVSADELRNLVKDLRGGLQIEKIPKDSINRGTFENGDIIVRGNDERIQQMYQLLSLFRQSKDHSIRVQILRDGNLKNGLLLKGVDVTEKMLAQQNKIIKAACKHKEVKKRPLCKA